MKQFVHNEIFKTSLVIEMMGGSCPSLSSLASTAWLADVKTSSSFSLFLFWGVVKDWDSKFAVALLTETDQGWSNSQSNMLLTKST